MNPHPSEIASSGSAEAAEAASHPASSSTSAYAGSALQQALQSHLQAALAQAGGWLSFEAFMSAALYAPGLGYYARGDAQFGAWPEVRDGPGPAAQTARRSDFITAPELSPLFARALARQVAQALTATHSRTVMEFGAGTGALAAGLLQALDDGVDHYDIVEVSTALRERQAATVARLAPAHAHKVRWLNAWPNAIEAVVVGNEVLDAMPVTLLAWDGAQWLERGVVDAQGAWAWADRPTDLRPPTPPEHDDQFVPGTVVELPRQALGFMRSLAQALRRGAAFFIDYGFPEHEFYHPQRTGGTLMCHRAQQADTNPLADVGDKDITAHVDFTAIALTGQDAGLEVLGYTSQARFLINCGIADDLQAASDAGDVRTLAHAQKLITEHEMGELFKVVGFATAEHVFDALGFVAGDRGHTL